MNWALFLSGKPRPVGGELHNPDPDTYSLLFYTSYKKGKVVAAFGHRTHPGGYKTFPA